MPSAKIQLECLRIVNSGKTPDRFLTAKIIHPPDAKEKGRIFCLLEILNPYPSHRQIGLTILNTLKNSYYSADSTSDMQNFEQALKKINETLAQIAQNGETSWIGRLNAVFCLIIGTDAHLGYSGDIHGWLLREGKSSRLIDDSQKISQPHPLKTFTAVTSGSLLKNDRVVLASSDMLKNFSAGEIKNIIDRAELYGAGEEIVQSLRRKKERSVGLMAIGINQAVAGMVNEVQEITFYLDEATDSFLSRALKSARKYLIPQIVKISAGGKQYLKSGIHIAKTKILPRSQTIIRQTAQHSSRLTKKYIAMAKPKLAGAGSQARKILSETLKRQKNLGEMNQNINIIGKPLYTINDYKMRQKFWGKIYFFSLGSIRRLIYYSIRRADDSRRWMTKNSHRPLALLIGAIILIIILIVSISFQRRAVQERKVRESYRTTLQKAQEKLEEGNTALIFGSKETAVALFKESSELAGKLGGTELKDDADKIINEVSRQSDGLTQTTRIKATAPFAAEIDSRIIFSYQGFGFFPIESSNEIVKVNILSGEKQTVGRIDNQDGFWRQALKAAEDKFWLLTDKGIIYDLNLKNNELKKLELGENKAAQDFDIFGNNIYLLSPNDKQIWKYNQTENKYQPPIKFAQGSLAKILGEAKAMTIDGSVYVLSDKNVVKIVRGTKADFNLKNLPKAYQDLSGAVDIYTSEEIPSIYVLDAGGGRIIEFDKDGNYIHQYILPSSIGSPVAFQVDHKGKKVWILADKKGYEMDL